MVLPAWLGMQAEPFKYLCVSLLCLTVDVLTSSLNLLVMSLPDRL